MAKKNVKQAISLLVNEEIKYYTSCRIIGEGIESRIVSLEEAKRIANEMEKDLIAINTTAEIPILRIDSYDKFLYRLKKQEKDKKKPLAVKEIQLGVNIAPNDALTKANHAREFIEKGHKVKVILTMRGRELARREQNKKSILEFIDSLSDVAVPESMPRDEGKKTIVMLKRKTQTKGQ